MFLWSNGEIKIKNLIDSPEIQFNQSVRYGKWNSDDITRDLVTEGILQKLE